MDLPSIVFHPNFFHLLDLFLTTQYTIKTVPGIFEADDRPLDMEDIVTDHIGFTVFHQKLKTIHDFLDFLLMQHITNHPQVHILCEKKKKKESQNPRWDNVEV